MSTTNVIEIHQKNTPREQLEAMYDEFHKLPIQMNKVVCSNFHGKGFGCNPKYIVKELLDKELDLDIVWLVTGEYELPEGVRTVPFHSVEAIREIATARVLIDNQMKFPGFKKRPEQFFVQTWHGAIPLKKIGFDNPPNKKNKKYSGRVKLNFKNTDLVISNSSFCTDLFRRSFEYKGDILEKGYPRNDVFFENQDVYKAKVCSELGIPTDKKLLLYAPTFRKDRSLDAYQMDYERVLDQLGTEWVLLIRLHPHLQSQAKNIAYNDRVLNGSRYDDMQELMAAADMLITDYSNIMFEFSLTERPCVLYATDIEAYRKERDYYFEIYKLPFPVAATSDELIGVMQHFDNKAYIAGLKRFFRKVNIKEDGKAASAAAEIVVKMVKGESYIVPKPAFRLHIKPFVAKVKRKMKRIMKSGE